MKVLYMMILLSYQRYDTLKVHRTCKHTLIVIMLLLPATSDLFQAVANQTAIAFHYTADSGDCQQ